MARASNEAGPPEKRVFLNLYSGDRFIFKIATHTSLYIEGDEFEWTYANTSCLLYTSDAADE